ncbi:MAG: Beta-1,3-glucosyltransferase [uncultured Solirubrobacteraceae bacterium]|uniref:Beta-1,3-glucosyltransferase n=1 Tax=uncultured Solirubrobacteraceae bacterium TaxID=1162706 RepID=A0A6J4TK04_9ACTN|nr:MAG: Beta-1,3-glucosyltransferase [uncultured Solirubrobacteraceae bacterium]
MDPLVSVIMPAYGQAPFVPRALGGLLAQTEQRWELVVVDDGSPDDVAAALPDDPRIRVERHAANRGLGVALNTGLDAVRAPLVAYLPCDDLWFPPHLETLLATLGDAPEAEMAIADLDLAGDDSGGPDPWPQLVQVAHRAGPERWVERRELESDDLARLFWDRLPGPRRTTGEATCRWVAHPGQRHRALRPSCGGGLNVFRVRYGITEPLRIDTEETGVVDEVARYARFRERPAPGPAADGLTILLVGELAHNPERILALAERGHRLLGLWTPDGLGFHTVGPLPFEGVEELDATDWRAAIRRAKPDVIYALLNWRAVPFAHAVLDAGLGIPFVWHFKEAPQRSILAGDWPRLADLVSRADACLLSGAAERDWFQAALPGRLDPARTHVMDGDLPKRDWLDAAPAPRLSAADGMPHVALLGRAAGIEPADLVRFTDGGVHAHLHGPATAWAREAAGLAPDRIHIEGVVEPARWVSELSRYDAGLLHTARSTNGGDVRRATWDDLDLPARLPILLAAGLPPIARGNPGAVVAVEAVLAELGCGLIYEELEDLLERLVREIRGRELGDRAWAWREELTFDHHADRLVGILRTAADSR